MATIYRRRFPSAGRRMVLWICLLRRRFRRRAPAWARELGPPLTSLLGHALVILLLALVIHTVSERPAADTSIEGQLREDLTSLAPGERAGDPFTRLDTPEPPSLPMRPDAIDPTVINVPETAVALRLDPDLSLRPDPTPGDGAPAGARGKGPGPGAGKPGGVAALFSGRRGPKKAALIRREGGTVESEKAVERGLDWIARHQRPDGGWGLDTSPMCEAPGCPPRASMDSDTGATGLALLPLLGAGHTHVEPGRYQQAVGRGLAWLVKNQQPDGSLFTTGGHHEGIYSHAIAAMALGEAYALTRDPALRGPVQRAVKYLQQHASPAGGWRYEPQQPGDTSVLGWVLFALRSANLGEVKVPGSLATRARRYLDTAQADRSGMTYCYMPGWNLSMTMTAEGLVSRQILGWAKDRPAMVKGARLVASHLAEDQTRNIYYWYYATQLLHNMGGDDWEWWNPIVREKLIAMQMRGIGCDRGSWDPELPEADVWGAKAGRLYTTSLSLLTLEVYYRYLPLYQDRGGQIEGADEPRAQAVAAP
jgi:hypothetical protein